MIPSIVRLVVSLFDVKETVPSPSIFGLDPCTLFCSMVGSILIFSCFNRLLLPGNPPLTYEQAQHELSLMRPETLWGQIEQVLSLYLTNWGEKQCPVDILGMNSRFNYTESRGTASFFLIVFSLAGNRSIQCQPAKHLRFSGIQTGALH